MVRHNVLHSHIAAAAAAHASLNPSACVRGRNACEGSALSTRRVKKAMLIRLFNGPNVNWSSVTCEQQTLDQNLSCTVRSDVSDMRAGASAVCGAAECRLWRCCMLSCMCPAAGNCTQARCALSAQQIRHSRAREPLSGTSCLCCVSSVMRSPRHPRHSL